NPSIFSSRARTRGGGNRRRARLTTRVRTPCSLSSELAKKHAGLGPAFFIYLGFSKTRPRRDFVRGEKRRFARDLREVVRPYSLDFFSTIWIAHHVQSARCSTRCLSATV